MPGLGRAAPSAADHAADKTRERALDPLGSAVIQRACASTCGCATCKATERALGLQRSAMPGAGPPTVNPEAVKARLGPGVPLPETAVEKYSEAYGRDLSKVRVHPESHVAVGLGARAFAVGGDVAFAPGHYRPGTPEGDALLGHELAHVVQQGGGYGAVQGSGLSEDAYEHEADRASAVAQSGRKVDRLSAVGKPAVQRFGWSDIGGAIVGGAKAIGGAVEDVAEAGWDALVDAFWALVREIAPSAEPYLRNPSKLWDDIKDAVLNGLDKLVGGVFKSFGEGGIFSPIGGFFKEIGPAISKIQQGIKANDHAQLVAGVHAAVDVFAKMADTVVAPIKKVFDTISSAISAVFEKVVAPIIDLVKDLAKGVWDAIESLADGIVWIGKKVSAALTKVWNWIKRKLDWGDDDGSKDGVWAKIKKWAGGLWDSAKATLLKWVEPLKTVAKVLLVLSPAGPMILAFKYGPKIVHWIKELWKSLEDKHLLVRARNFAIRAFNAACGFFKTAAAFLAGVAATITEKLSGIADAVNGVLDALSSNTFFAILTAGVRLLGKGIAAGITWVNQHLPPFIEKVGGFFTRVCLAIKPILDVLVRIAVVIANPLGIPLFVASLIWKLCPAWLKVVIVAFVLEILIRFIQALPDGALAIGLGPLAPLVKHGVLGFLKKLYGEGGGNVDKTVSAMDRVARLAAGGGIDFVAGFVVGILSGIWDGIVGPFEMVAMVIEGVAKVFEWIDNAAKDLPKEVSGLFSGIGKAAMDVANSVGPAVKAVFSGSGAGGAQKLLSMLGSAWGAITGAAQSVGGAVAGALMSFLMLPDYELGNKLGWVAGTIIFEVALAVLTGGASSALAAAKGPLAAVLKLIVKIHQAFGKVMESVLHFLGPIQRAISKGLKALGDIPAVKSVIRSLEGLFAKLEGATAKALGKLEQEVATTATTKAAKETATVAAKVEAKTVNTEAKAASKVETEAAATETKAAKTEGQAAKAETETAKTETKATQAETKEAREARVKETEHVDNAKLTKGDADAQLKHLEDNPHLVEGTPPNRKAKIGDHTWEEQPGGGWCRHSAGEFCVTNAAVPEKLAAKGEGAVAKKTEAEVAKDAEATAAKKTEAEAAKETEANAAKQGEKPKSKAEERKAAQEDKAWEKRQKEREVDPAKKAKQEEQAWETQRKTDAKDARELKQLEKEEVKAQAEADAALAKAEAEAQEKAARDALEKQHRELLDEIGKKRKALEELERKKTLTAEERELRGELQKEQSELVAKLQENKRAIEQASDAYAQKLRDATPNKSIRDRVNAGDKVDPIYGHKVESLAADHIVPVDTIKRMKGFDKLPFEKQVEVLNLEKNFMGLDPRLNSSKGALSWSEWKGHPDFPPIPNDVRDRMLKAEAEARKALEEAIEARLPK